ncbi:hypothetical protein GTPT_3383 [Tatumella ptyseos ATCC 33301]|uniref:Uncharacterized protein n=2 Tax=Tatumella ptyseos TaxID=82987 RepID=A0A085J9G2_9GAMM|nr:hypothetical protein GTPT_3383 [Tatumella ptyseos ATCC 33301]SQK72329.1 Uncharacterised protein [Tatumella ptyseos]
MHDPFHRVSLFPLPGARLMLFYDCHTGQSELTLTSTGGEPEYLVKFVQDNAHDVQPVPSGH